MEAENFNLTSVPATETFCISDVEGKSQEETNNVRAKNIFHLLSKIYAQLLVVITVIAIFIEVLHRSIPLFYIHAYFYFYLLGVSILIFFSSFVSRCIHKFNEQSVQLEIWEKNNNHVNITRYFMFGLVVCGLATAACTSLGSIAAFISRACTSSKSSAFHTLHSIFVILQLAFLLSVKRYNFAFVNFHKIGIMHLVATNVALWFYVLLWESSKDWQDTIHIKHNSSLTWGRKEINITLHSLEFDVNSINDTNHFPKHAVHVTSNCWWKEDVPESEFSEDILTVELCLQNSFFGLLWKKAFKCLYPFNMQYYLIVLFLLHTMWQNLSLQCKKQCSSMSAKAHNAKHFFFLSKSFYLGCLYFISSIVIVILYFVLNIQNFDVVLMSMLCIIFASAIFAVFVGMCQLKPAMMQLKLPNQTFFNYYQEIGIYFVYVYGASNLLVGCLSGGKYNLLLIIESLLMIFHGATQYIFIQSPMKSRQAVNFLILSNASLWALESSLYCYDTPVQAQIKIYGLAWPIMNRIIVPCLAFYRFQSVVVFFNMSKFVSLDY